MRDVRDDARAGFENTFGHTPLGLWSAPGRVTLIGEHSVSYDGFVLPLAINRRTVVALGARDDRRMRIASSYADEVAEIDLSALEPGAWGGWSAYPLGVAWSLGQFGADLAAVPGLDLFIESDVPVGTGLSSSAAIESAVALALNDAWQLDLSRETLALVGQAAESAAVGGPTGIADQWASLLGRAGSAILLDGRSRGAEFIDLGLEQAGLCLLVMHTGVTHARPGDQAFRRAACEAGARMLGVESLRDVSIDDLPRARQLLDEETFRQVRHVVTENQRVLDTVHTLRREGPGAIGTLLDESHRSLRDSINAFMPELDLAVEVAHANGAIGVRMAGDGFGGTAVALLPTASVSLVQVALDGAFSEHGYSPPDTFMVTASGGATREP